MTRWKTESAVIAGSQRIALKAEKSSSLRWGAEGGE